MKSNVYYIGDSWNKFSSKIKNDIDHDHHFHFTQEMMEELHGTGELVVEVESDEGESMIILYTYKVEEIETEELEEAYDELTSSLLDDELDEYIDKLTDSIKKL